MDSLESKRSRDSLKDGGNGADVPDAKKRKSDSPASCSQEEKSKNLAQVTSPDNSSVVTVTTHTLKRPPDDSSNINSPSKKRKISPKHERAEGVKQSHPLTKEDIDRKKKRIKNRALRKAVLEQMEFYFSDSSLSKDRFLRQMYDCSEDGYIELSVFEKFNKLQSLDKDGIHVDFLSKALAKSKLLEVSEDLKKVRRKTALVELTPEEIDRRTVYVEHLPEHASHSWLEKIFSQCGKVCYVSLPKYQTTKEIKGFAFVEFSSAEEASKACTMLNNPAPVRAEERAGKFPKWNKTLRGLHKSAPPVKAEDGDGNEENVQTEANTEDQTPSPAKKKTNTKKSKDEECDDSVSEAVPGEGNEDQKKKKKKKKKKQVLLEDKGQVAMETDHEPELKEIDKDSAGEGKEGPEEKAGKKKKKKKKKKVPACEAAQEKDSEMNEMVEKKTVDTVSVKDEVTNTKSDSSKATDSAGKPKSDDILPNASIEKEASKELPSDIANLSRKERKRLRQEDIRRKKAERAARLKEEEGESSMQQESAGEADADPKPSQILRQRQDSLVSESSETDSPSKVYIKRDGSQVTSILARSRKQDVVKRVEFDPVPVTTEFVERKEVRRRKKPRRDGLHLRVLSKKEWLDLRAEYLHKQKRHMSALKESLRELRMQENAGVNPEGNNGKKHVDLTSVFGVSRTKPSEEVKLAHVEELKFVPNVIVQWKCSHEISRSKIRTMFDKVPSESIAYIEGTEEEKCGFIRFKDEVNAEEFAKLSRNSDSFSARVLPMCQQAAYWEKANSHRMAKLSRKKKERGTDKIAKKVFERNKATFLAKGSHVVFDDDEADAKDGDGDDAKEGDGEATPNKGSS